MTKIELDKIRPFARLKLMVCMAGLKVEPGNDQARKMVAVAAKVVRRSVEKTAIAGDISVIKALDLAEQWSEQQKIKYYQLDAARQGLVFYSKRLSFYDEESWLALPLVGDLMAAICYLDVDWLETKKKKFTLVAIARLENLIGESGPAMISDIGNRNLDETALEVINLMKEHEVEANMP
jgi:hypothetical protein